MTVSPRSPHADGSSNPHAARAALYQALFELLRRPPGAQGFDAARRTLGPALGTTSGAALAEALAGADLAEVAGQYGALFMGPSPKVAAVCALPGCGIRVQAFRSADTLPGPERAGELQVLGTLAERTDRALSAGVLPEAEALTQVQARFLSLHAGGCLVSLSRELEGGESRFWARVGAVLGGLLAEDLRLLGHPDAAP